MKKNSKKGQIWTADFIAGLILFIFVLLFTTKITLSMSIPEEEPATYKEAIYLSEALLSQGYPKNWTSDLVIIPGISNDNRINQTKLEELKEISYDQTKALYSISGEYLFFFKNETSILNISGCTFGYNVSTDNNCEPQLDSSTYSDLSKIERTVIYNYEVIKLIIYVWN
jgi:hypothetical protein